MTPRRDSSSQWGQWRWAGLITQAVHGVDPARPAVGSVQVSLLDQAAGRCNARRLRDDIRTRSRRALRVPARDLERVDQGQPQSARLQPAATRPTGSRRVSVAALGSARRRPRAVWWIAIGTGVSHGFYFYWLARALASGELSIVYPIARSAPAFLPLFAVLLLARACRFAARSASRWWWPACGPCRQMRASWDGSVSARPGAKFAWLTLLASIGYSLCDKAAMTRLNVAPGIRRFRRPWSTTCCSRSRGGGVHAARAATRAARGAGGGRAQRVAQCLPRRGCEFRELRADPASAAQRAGVVRRRRAPDSVLFAVAIGALRWRERPSRLRLSARSRPSWASRS